MNHKKEVLRSLWVGVGVASMSLEGYRGVVRSEHALLSTSPFANPSTMYGPCKHPFNSFEPHHAQHLKL